MIKLARPDLDERDLEAVRAVLLSGQLVQGPQVQAFEAAVARYVGVEHAVAVSNCTSALYLALRALGVRGGDVVVVAAYSWPATANGVALLGATPVFVDIDRSTFNIDPRALERTLDTWTRGGPAAGRVKAVIPVHAFGLLADMDAIEPVCRRYAIPIVEDAACALGAELRGRQAGAWSAMACFSFHPRKAITTGEGGMIVTNDAALAREARVMRNHGLDPDAAAPDFVDAGFNMRLTEFQAALGVSQMSRLEGTLATRRQQARRYDELFSRSPVTSPVEPDGCVHVYQSYVVLLPASHAARRQEIIAGLRDEGVETTIGTYLMPFTTYYKARGGHSRGSFPIGEDVAARALALPLHAQLTEHAQATVAQRLLDRLA